MIIAVDFDGTLCEHKFPEIGEPKIGLILKLILMKMEGHKLILWTCRHGESLDEAVEWCKEFGLHFDAVNDDVEETKKVFKGKSQKIFADIYIDDRNKNIEEFLKEGL